jgi:hypothetical protein
MPLFLCCYDYGMGGIWLYVEAESAQQVRDTYNLIVFERPPDWLDEESEADARRHVSTDPFWRDWLNQFIKR